MQKSFTNNSIYANGNFIIHLAKYSDKKRFNK